MLKDKSRPAYWMAICTFTVQHCLRDLSSGSYLPLIYNQVSLNDKNSIMQIDARANMVGNYPEPVPYFCRWALGEGQVPVFFRKVFK